MSDTGDTGSQCQPDISVKNQTLESNSYTVDTAAHLHSQYFLGTSSSAGLALCTCCWSGFSHVYIHQDYNQDLNEGLHSRPCFNSVTLQSQRQSQSEILGRGSRRFNTRIRKGYSVVYSIWVGTAAWGKGSSEVSGPGRECFARLIQPLQPRETTVNGLQSFDRTRKKWGVSGRWGSHGISGATRPMCETDGSQKHISRLCLLSLPSVPVGW